MSLVCIEILCSTVKNLGRDATLKEVSYLGGKN